MKVATYKFVQCSSALATSLDIKITQRVTILQTVSNQEVTLKTDKHAADCSKAVCWGVK